MRKLIRPCPSEWTTMEIHSTPYTLLPNTLYPFAQHPMPFCPTPYALLPDTVWPFAQHRIGFSPKPYRLFAFSL